MKILHLEDDPGDVQLVRELLREEWSDCVINAVASQAEYLEELKRGDHDLILSDFTLVSFTGLDALKIARAQTPETPFVFLSGTIGEDRALDAIRDGAADYVLKDRMKRLTTAVRRALRESGERRARKLAEQAQRRIVSILDNTPDLVAMALTDGTLIYLNDSGRRLIGMMPGEAPESYQLASFYTIEASRRLTDEAIPTAIREGVWSGETEICARDGRIIPVSQVIIAHHDATRALSHISTVVRDISSVKASEAELKRNETTLRASNERFELVARATNDVIWDWNLVTNQLWWNEGYEIVFGRSRTTVATDISSWTSYIHPEDLQRAQDSIHHAIAEGRETWTEEYRFKRADGSYAEVLDRGFILRDANGRAHRMLGSMQDITARKASEARIREQADLLNKARDAIVVADARNRISFWNEGAARLMGWSVNEACGKTIAEIFGMFASPQFSKVARDTETAGNWEGEVRAFTKAGHPLTLEMHSTLIRDASGNPKAYFHIVTDVTEKNALQDQLLRVQRLESIGMLAAGIAHDINNILTPILMAAPMLRRHTTDPMDLRLLQTLERSAERGAGLVRQILAFAHGTAGEPRPTPLKHLVRDIIDVVEETFPKLIKLDLDFAVDTWSIVANPTQIHQVLLNLCVNARDAMPTGGTLRLRTANVRLDDNTATAIVGGRPGAFVVIEVSDTGTGIPPETLARMWEPFFTTKGEGKGTGLGLSTVRGIVQTHHGFIELETKVDHGTKFRVYLPAVDVSDEELERASSTPFVTRGNGELILLVDDEQTNREVTQATLARQGYRVLAAANGTEAVALFVPRADEVRLVICDLNMPKPGGVAVSRSLQRLKPDVKVLIISGLTAAADRKSTASAPPFSGFLAKPFSAEALLQHVSALLHGNPQAK
ncbi:PAS domain S-box protein [Oleiharenicola lentus]|uniref:PAS domain-containing hybrid sensor histidine kinase/response regulator n=1 Tax=Oleiharenicola lentus TaxID=2508720 RepID=UPI003F66599E